MIFVTVGTHEQSFNRLIKKVDQLIESGVISEPVIMQTGFSTYEPKHAEWHKLLPYPQVLDNVKNARIVITHGGPASFLLPLQFGKIPIVVPRRLQYNEHVNDHQAEFAKAVAQRMKNIILVEDIVELGDTIQNYDNLILSMQDNELQSNNARFNKEFESIVKSMFTEENK